MSALCFESVLTTVKTENIMTEIENIIGDSGRTFFKMTDGQIIAASSEFRAKSGEIDGFIVYKEKMQYHGTGVYLTRQEISELVERYDAYKLAHHDVVDWV